MRFFLILCLLMSGVVFARSGKPPAQTPDPTVPTPGKFKSLFPKQEWTDAALAAVSDAGLDVLKPRDGSSFCANGMTAHNWVHLLAAMAKYESGFDPTQVYREPAPLNQNSIGLLQLSLTDKSYGCAFKTDSDIKDPFKNLACGVKILKKLITSDGIISGYANKHYLGGARYWSVLRSSGKLASVKATLKGNCE